MASIFTLNLELSPELRQVASCTTSPILLVLRSDRLDPVKPSESRRNQAATHHSTLWNGRHLFHRQSSTVHFTDSHFTWHIVYRTYHWFSMKFMSVKRKKWLSMKWTGPSGTNTSLGKWPPHMFKFKDNKYNVPARFRGYGNPVCSILLSATCILLFVKTKIGTYLSPPGNFCIIMYPHSVCSFQHIC